MKYEITNFKEQVNDTRKTVAYVRPRGESIMENLVNRHNRPHELWKPMVEMELRARGVNFERLTWSQYAGCSCPCSPGFILSRMYRDEKGMPSDIHVTVVGNDAAIAEGGPQIRIEWIGA